MAEPSKFQQGFDSVVRPSENDAYAAKDRSAMDIALASVEEQNHETNQLIAVLIEKLQPVLKDLTDEGDNARMLPKSETIGNASPFQRRTWVHSETISSTNQRLRDLLDRIDL